MWGAEDKIGSRHLQKQRCKDMNWSNKKEITAKEIAYCIHTYKIKINNAPRDRRKAIIQQLKILRPDKIQTYSKTIGLVPKLTCASKSKKQADLLLEIQKSILKYDRVSYQDVKKQNETIKDPNRDLISVLSKITDIENYISKYHDGLFFYSELIQLNKLKEKLSEANRIKTKDIVDIVMKTIEKELLDYGFSKEIITKGSQNTLPLKTIFKSLLTD